MKIMLKNINKLPLIFRALFFVWLVAAAMCMVLELAAFWINYAMKDMALAGLFARVAFSSGVVSVVILVGIALLGRNPRLPVDADGQ